MLSVYSTWQSVPRSLSGTVVVIDVLRWSTSVVTALANGAAHIEAFAEPEQAAARAREINALTAGERDSHTIPGFDLGNSPREYSAMRVKGRVICSTTTNGTHALLTARDAKHVFVGAFVNLLPTAAAALATGEDITIICAGQAGSEALEDTACAGAMIEWLLAAGAIGERELAAPARHARAMWVTNHRSVEDVFRNAPHARALAAAGYQEDLADAAEYNTLPVVAVAQHNVVRQLSVVPSHSNSRA
jgi:2-phosphosulfolactate phosphatase